MTAGYSRAPLAKKLGYKPNCVVSLVNPPDGYETLVEPLPEGVKLSRKARPGSDLLHFFTNSRDELFRGLAEYRNTIRQDGSIWVSWYKKAARSPTEITEDVIREAALPLGLVDVKVCAVDEKWSALKLVIRRENRL